MPKLARRITQFTKQEISDLFKKAQRVKKKSGLDIRLAQAERNFGRILIVIPKRSGNAATRNRARRRIKATFYEEKLYEQGKDCIVLLNKTGALNSFETIKTVLTDAFKTD